MSLLSDLPPQISAWAKALKEAASTVKAWAAAGLVVCAVLFLINPELVPGLPLLISVIEKAIPG